MSSVSPIPLLLPRRQLPTPLLVAVTIWPHARASNRGRIQWRSDNGCRSCPFGWRMSTLYHWTWKYRINRHVVRCGWCDVLVKDLVETNVPISVPILNRETKVPFGFENGAFHLPQPVTFAPDKEESNSNRALKYSTEGSILQEHPDNEY